MYGPPPGTQDAYCTALLLSSCPTTVCTYLYTRFFFLEMILERIPQATYYSHLLLVLPWCVASG